MPGNETVNQYKDLTVTIGSGSGALEGLISVQYTMNRNINTIFRTGSSVPAGKYGDLPDIEVSYTGHAAKLGSFTATEANAFQEITINGKEGSVTAGLALLSSFSYDFTIDKPFAISKTFKGYSKTSSSGGGLTTTTSEYPIASRKDFSGSLPAGISGNYLQSVKASISINRELVKQFANRKPYASIIKYPISQSITYELITSAMDTIEINDLYEACKNPSSSTYNASFSACGVSFSVNKAYITNISYSGAEASSSSSPQTMSVTYTSYEDIEGLEPIVYFD